MTMDTNRYQHSERLISTPDRLPLIGPLPGISRCYIAGGYTGHGNTFAIQAAQLIGELVLGKTNPDAELFDPARFGQGG